jgi:hypothetical protein
VAKQKLVSDATYRGPVEDRPLVSVIDDSRASYINVFDNKTKRIGAVSKSSVDKMFSKEKGKVKKKYDKAKAKAGG